MNAFDQLGATNQGEGLAIVEDHDPTRLALQETLSEPGEFRCVGCYANGEDALDGIPKVRPRIVLVDILLPGMSGIECTLRLKGLLPGLIIVLVSGLTDEETMSEALKAGGDGYLTKPFTVDQCLAELRFAFGRSASGAGHSSAVDALSATASQECVRLTQRENEVMRLLAKGLFYKEIAAELEISYSTVHKHQQNIFLKLHVANRTEAAIKWYDAKQS